MNAGPVSFQEVVPVSNDALRANIRHALSLGLPELRDFEYPRKETLAIVANGPTARVFDGGAPPLPDTLALNGALQLFDVSPKYWAACDPQELVAERFLANELPEDTIYLVASKCHPKVFEVLRGYNVVLWHVWESALADEIQGRLAVPASSSITTTSFELMAHLGYRSFEVWGWDGCVIDGVDHAACPDGTVADRCVQVGHDGPIFHTTATWANEAQGIADRLVGFPFPIHIHGNGMMAALLKAWVPFRVTGD